MWMTKLRLKHKDCPIVNRCEQFKLLVYSYPSHWYEKKGKKFATTTCYFSSPDEQNKRFLFDLKKDKRITHLEISNDIFTYEIDLGRKGEHVMLYRNQQIFFVKPTINHFDGHEYWEVASWKKEELQKFIAMLRKHMDICEILQLKQAPLTDIYFPNVMPSISKSQKKALELAHLHGYYSYPRKITLEKLAKLSKIGISTFQEHLRKAELRLLPVLIEQQKQQ